MKKHLSEEDIMAIKKFLSKVDVMLDGFKGSIYGQHSIHFHDVAKASSTVKALLFPTQRRDSKWKQVDLEEAIKTEKDAQLGLKESKNQKE